MKINSNPVFFSPVKPQKQVTNAGSQSSGQSSCAQQISAYYPHPSFFGKKKDITRAEIAQVIKTSKPFSNAGLKGSVYKTEKNGKAFAIKVSKSKEFNFKKEAEILAKLPENIGDSQKLVDYYKDAKTGRDILVTTFVNGEKGVLNTKEDFVSFFDTLSKLDESEVLHGDLNMQNCLFDENGVNLIDFGEGEIFSTGDNYPDLMYPSFIVKSNVVNLEQNGIPDCLQAWDKQGDYVKEKYGEYLKAKGEYYERHAGLLEKAGADTEAIDYEKNYAKVLKNPDDDIIKNEIRRTDILYTFEQADTAVNYEKSPQSAKEIWNLTISKSGAHKKEIINTLKNENISSEKRKYFEYQLKIAEKFEDTYKDWGGSTIEWINSLYSKPQHELSAHESELMQNESKKMPLPPDLNKLID